MTSTAPKANDVEHEDQEEEKVVRFAPLNDTDSSLIAVVAPIPVDSPEQDNDEDRREELVARVLPRPVYITTPKPDRREELVARVRHRPVYITTRKPTTVSSDIEVTTHDEVAEASTEAPGLAKSPVQVPGTHILIDHGGYATNNNGTVVAGVGKGAAEGEPSPAAADSGSTSMTLIAAPLFVGIGLIVIAVIFFVHYKKKSRSYKRKSRNGGKGRDHDDDKHLELGGTLYSMSRKDYNKKLPEEEVLLQELNMVWSPNGGTDVKTDSPVKERKQNGYASTDYATTLVDNELHHTSLPTETRPDSDASLCTNDSDLWTLLGLGLPLQLPSKSSTAAAEAGGAEAGAGPSDDGGSGEYLMPSCHDHSQTGPDWKPFHDYDPVYVPHDDPSAMARRLDKAGYVTSKHQRELRNQPPTDPYEDVQVYTDIGPDNEDDTVPENTPPPPVMRAVPGTSIVQTSTAAAGPSASRRRPPAPSPSSPTTTHHQADNFTLPPPRPERSTSRTTYTATTPEQTPNCDNDSERSSEQRPVSEELYEPVTFELGFRVFKRD